MSKGVASIAKEVIKLARRHGPEFVKATRLSLKSRNKLEYPKVINMMANDICNSKCTMCNIWQQKLDFEITAEQLETSLRNPLFQKVERVGVTGGEPTMREDLASLYEACCKSLPALKGMSIITNAIKEKDVITRINEVADVLDRHNKSFSIMVSLDGVGKVHDDHRGREGNFDTAVNVINHFKNQGKYPVTIGCTITKQNVWNVDELLDYVIDNNINARFRMGEFIQRLYNTELVDEIRNFNRDEIYHLLSFYERLIKTYERNPKYIRTYRSIQNILKGNSRTIGCPYQGDGVVLDSRGQILYCAPKSKELGSTLEDDAENLYFGNEAEMDRILENHCSDCIHDYHAPPTFTELKATYRPELWRMMMGIYNSTWSVPLLSKSETISRNAEKKILITGWYGTETVGDKAILMGILNHYWEKFGRDHVETIITAIQPFHTKRTLDELNIKAQVIPVYSRTFIDHIASSDLVVMGGGPLMDMESMAIPLSAFKIAKKYGVRRVVYGCGLGPLKKAKYQRAATKVLKLADEIYLRDSDSVALAQKITKRTDIQLSGDPAHHYLKSLPQHPNLRKKPILACFLREWPRVYASGLDGKEYETVKENFEQNLAAAIKSFCKEFHLTPSFHCMHTFVHGGDDRIFYRKFIQKYFSDHEYFFSEKAATVEDTRKTMLEASYNICMRFHSVLFAHTLDTNFLAIDYTMGGKIKHFLQDNELLHRMTKLQTIADNSDFRFVVDR